MNEPYKFGTHNAESLVERGKNLYGTKVDNSVCECPKCYGGGMYGMFKCENCKGTGMIKNQTDGQEVLEHQEEEQDEGESPVKTKKKMGPYFEKGK